MNLSNILPSIRYSTGAGSQLSIDVQPTRIISGRFRIRPKSQYEKKLLNAALIQTNSGLVISQDSPQTFSIGGVRVLSQRFSRLSNSADAESDTDEPSDLRSSPSHPSPGTASSSFTENNLAAAIQRYNKSNHHQSPTPNVNRRQKSANLLIKRSMHNQAKVKNASNSRLLPEHNINNGKNAILHIRNSNKIASKSLTSRNKVKPKGRQAVDETNHGKPEFTTSNAKAIKVFLSQKQSPDIHVNTPDKGSLSSRPSAPPGTPCLEMTKRFDYIPSLSDNLAKQQVKSKLKIMKKVETDREKIKQVDKMKNDLKEAKEREQELRKQQRRSIYALNSVMTKVENDQFERFKSDRGLKPKEYPSSANIRS